MSLGDALPFSSSLIGSRALVANLSHAETAASVSSFGVAIVAVVGSSKRLATYSRVLLFVLERSLVAYVISADLTASKDGVLIRVELSHESILHSTGEALVIVGLENSYSWVEWIYRVTFLALCTGDADLT